MRFLHRAVAALCPLPAVTVAVLTCVCANAAIANVVSQDRDQEKHAAQRQLPLVFERNEGQFARDIQFLARTNTYSVEVTPHSLHFLLQQGGTFEKGIVLSMGSNNKTEVRGITEAPFRTNIYVGDDSARWRTGVHNYSRLGIPDLYRGIDSEFYATDGEIEHDFIVAPGADPGLIEMQIESAKAASLDPSGDVIVHATEGELRLKKPIAYQLDAAGNRVAVDVKFLLDSARTGSRRLRFALGNYNHSKKLVIDPVIVYSTFVAGAVGSKAASVAADPIGADGNNNVYLSGTTASVGLEPSGVSKFGNTNPLCTPSGTPTSCPQTAFVAMFAPASYGQTPSWITYVGGEASSQISITSSVVGASTLFIGGTTNAKSLTNGSTTLATSNAPVGSTVGFIFGLDAQTGAVAGSRFVYLDEAGVSNATVQALALDHTEKNLYLAGALGTTQVVPASLALSPTTTNAFDSTKFSSALPVITAASATPGNAYVMELPVETFAASSPTLFTYIQSDTQLQAIAVDSADNIYVAGQTAGPFDYPAPTQHSKTLGLDAAFELVFAPGTGSAAEEKAFTWLDEGAATKTTIASVAIDDHGTAFPRNSYLFGNTSKGTLFSTSTCSLQCTSPGNVGFVAAIDATGAVSSSTYLYGSGSTNVVNAGTFLNGMAYIAGQTDAPAAGKGGIPFLSLTLPLSSQILPLDQIKTQSAVKYGYLAALNVTTNLSTNKASLASVAYFANIGGSGGSVGDTSVAVAADQFQNVYVADNIAFGSSPYTPFSTFEALNPQTTSATNSAAYLAEVDYAPLSAQPIGLSLSPSSGSPSVDGGFIGYSATDPSTATFTWNLTAENTAENVVLSIPDVGTGATDYLTYSVPTVTGASKPVSCALTVGRGISCVVPTIAHGDEIQIVLLATANKNAQALTKASLPISVSAKAYSADSQSATSIQTVTVQNPSNLVAKLVPPVPNTVFASTQGYTPLPTVIYTITLTNDNKSVSNPGEAKSASLTISSLPTGFVPVSATYSSTGKGTPLCDVTQFKGCTSVDLPAGAVLTYNIKGYYDDKTLFNKTSNTLTTPSVVSGPMVVAFDGFLNSKTDIKLATNTLVDRQIALAPFVPVPIPDPQANLSTVLTASPVPYTFTVTNSGPSIAYNVSVTTPFPVKQGSGTSLTTGQFKVDSVSSTDSAGNAVSCQTVTGSPVSCTLAEIDAGKSVSFTVTTEFPDLAPLPDAVPAGLTSVAYNLTATANGPKPSYYVAGGQSTPLTPLPATIKRTANLVLSIATPPQVAPLCTTDSNAKSCVYMYNPSTNLNANANQYSLASYGLSVRNMGPNAATETSIAVGLPSAPGGHVLTTNAGSLTVKPDGSAGWSKWGANPFTPCTLQNGQYVCSGAAPAPAGIPAPTTPQEAADGVALNLALTGTFDAATVGVTVTSVDTSGQPGSLAVSSSAASKSSSTSVPPKSESLTGSLPVYQIDRSTHLVIRKTRNVSVAKAPASFALPNYPNLDENPGKPIFGLNDEIEYALAFGNGGVNDAPGVQFTEILPTYFTVETMYLVHGSDLAPDSGPNNSPSEPSVGTTSCFVGPSASGTKVILPFKTAGTPVQITCVIPALLIADKTLKNETTGAIAFGTNAIEFVYQGKYQDNANSVPSTDNIPGATPTAIIPSNAGDATAVSPHAEDYLYPTYFDYKSSALAPYTIQRAAHLNFYLSAAVHSVPTSTSKPDGFLTPDVTGMNAYQVGQAAAGATTPQGSPVQFNCARYKVYVLNSGPNISRQPMLSFSGNQFTVNSTKTGTTTAATAQAMNDDALSSTCSSSYGISKPSEISATSPLVPVSELTNNSMVFDVDGYYGLNTLNWAKDGVAPCYGNCGVRSAVFLGASLHDPGISDSDKTSMPADQPAKVTVVNTPIGTHFQISPYSTTGTTPTTLTFGNVTGSGVTGLSISPTGPIWPAGKPVSGPVRPYGSSPYPPDNGKIIPLYQAGQSPNFYTVPSTATIPIGSTNSNPTSICLANPASSTQPLTDIFVKPERALLWVLQNPTTGTSYPTPTPPHVSSDLMYGQGDVTNTVQPAGIPAYSALPANHAVYPYPPQPQPRSVCGTINGFQNSPFATNPSSATVFAVLEPVNFPPYVAATDVASTATGKGATDQIYTFSVTVGKNATYDVNDSDPCWAIPNSPQNPTNTPTRTTCDDNPYLQAWVFGGGNINGGSQVSGPTATPASNTQTATVTLAGTFDLQVGTDLYVAVADQTIGADALNPNINPNARVFSHQGGFLANVNNQLSVCDPGLPLGNYTPRQPRCTTSSVLSQAVGVYPQQDYVVGTNYGQGNVGAAVIAVNGGLSSGLIALPFPADPTNSAPSATSEAPIVMASITAGQTAGFAWNWLAAQPAGQYSLVCYLVDPGNLTDKIAMPAGMTCNLPATVTISATSSGSPINPQPDIYVATTGTLNAQLSSPAWKRTLGGVAIALLLPLLFVRRVRKLNRYLGLLVFAFLLAGTFVLSGCASNSFNFKSSQTTPAGTYYFRATATSGTTTYTTVPFEVNVKGGS
jgi:hypothetical protein